MAVQHTLQRPTCRTGFRGLRTLVPWCFEWFLGYDRCEGLQWRGNVQSNEKIGCRWELPQICIAMQNYNWERWWRKIWEKMLTRIETEPTIVSVGISPKWKAITEASKETRVCNLKGGRAQRFMRQDQRNQLQGCLFYVAWFHKVVSGDIWERASGGQCMWVRVNRETRVA